METLQDRQSIQQKTSWHQKFSTIAKRTSPPEISWLMAQALEVPGLISLAAGFVDQESLPHTEVSSVINNMLKKEESGQAALQYGTTQGDLKFRSLLIERLRKEGVFHPSAAIDESHCLVGSGSQQVLYLAAEALLDENDIVLLEAPTYFVVLGVFQSRGVQTLGIDTDRSGLLPEKLETCLHDLEQKGQLSRVKMLYLMSYATNPMGVTLPHERRDHILAILHQYREKGYPILLVEDAAYRRLMFDDNPPLPIKSREPDNDLILYTESFSKSLSPGFRLGFGIGPKALIDKMTDLKGNHDFGSSNLAQQIMKPVLQSGMFDHHIETLRKVYRQKKEIVWNILSESMPNGAEILDPTGAFYFWITLPKEWDTGTQGNIFKAALDEKVLYVPGCLCYSSDRPESIRSSSIRLSFGMIGEKRLEEGCKRLTISLQKAMDA